MDSKNITKHVIQQRLQVDSNGAKNKPTALFDYVKLIHQFGRVLSMPSAFKRLHTLIACLMLIVLAGCKLSWSADTDDEILFDTRFATPAIPALDAKQPSKLTVHFSINRDSVTKARKHAEEANRYQPKIPTHALRLHDNNIDLNEKISITPHVIRKGNRESIVLRPYKAR